MRNCNRLLFLVFTLLIGSNLSAQISGTSCFLQGQWLEIGEITNGAFGANGIPAGYHVHLGGATMPGTGSFIAEVYDEGHDGWAVGAPVGMGDYTYPGYPFEGWGLQVNVGRNHAFQSGGFMTSAGGSLTGTIVGYSNVGGSARSYWSGTASGGAMTVRQETRVDTLASAVVVTTVMVNTSATALPGVYYLRSCDPDNNVSWGGGSFTTNNIITYQNDVQHRVLASATSFTGPSSYQGLGTKDCRAKAFIYNSWPMSVAVDFADMYNMTVPGTYGPYYYDNINHTGDIGYGLVYNIGTIAAGDSAIVSYAYIYNGALGLDEAFPDPQIVINGVVKPTIPPPAPDFDTFDACESGLTTLPIDFIHADDKCWSWSSWTWAPGTGLASTTGIHNTINLGSLPPIITYTITGTDSGSHMLSCNNKVFYLTIRTCNGAEANSPCVGDTLFLNAPGDSLGATYKWYGPAPSTGVFATTQAYFRYPCAITDTGTYYVIKTVGGIPDTSDVHVSIYALPVPNLTTNQANCAPVVGSLSLTCTPDSVCTDFLWSGPGGFSSTLQNPVVNPFDSSKEGTYIVQVVSDHGCKNTGSVLVKPGPTIDFTFDQLPGCPQDSALFHAFGATNVSTLSWNFSNGSGSTLFEPLHIFSATVSGQNKYSVTVTATSANGCQKTATHEVDLRHTVTSAFTTASDPLSIADTVCFGNALQFTDVSTATKFGANNLPIVEYEWKFGDPEAGSDLVAAPNYTYLTAGVWVASLTVTDNIGCKSESHRNMVVIDPKIVAMSDSTFCLVRPLVLYNEVFLREPKDLTFPGFGFTYLWTPATNLSSDTEKEPQFKGIGSFTYTLTATLNRHGCTTSHVTHMLSVLPVQLHHVSIDATVKFGKSIQLYCDSEYLYTWTPNDGSLDNPNINNPIATPTVTTTYTVFGMDKYGCRDTAQITITVDSTMSEHIPTGFTPNGDGLNDVFRFNGGKHQKLVEMRVYNRWGEQVFYSNTREVGWDGTYKGVPADMGVYYYQIILARPGYPDNTVLKGEITLIR
jgi:gliding motility-associated-like protein